MSPDPIAPGLDNPQNRNRFSYTLNNPLRYTDPTGFCIADGSDDDDVDACTDQWRQLLYVGIAVTDYLAGLWSLSELMDFVAAVRDFQRAAGWDDDAFRSHIGDVVVTQSAELHGTALNGFDEADALTWPGAGYSSITFYQDAFTTVDGFKRTVVHELAHAWDFRSYTQGGSHSWAMMQATGSSYQWDGTAGSLKYQARGRTTLYAIKNGHYEDWAESVAAFVYPNGEIDANRRHFVASAMGLPSTPFAGGGAGVK